MFILDTDHIGVHLRIASIAIANQMTIATRNSVDFKRVPNLEVVDWTV